jgi:hypothetical protein
VVVRRKKSTPKKTISIRSAIKRALRPAAWYTDLGTVDRRSREVAYIKSTTKLLRKYFTGFDSKDGYDLRHPQRLSAQRLRAIRRYGSHLHTLTASPHYRAVARSDRDREALSKYTGQIYKGTKKQRAFVIHHPEASYRDIKIKVNKKGHVELVKKSSGVTTRSQIFVFIDYGFNPKSFTSSDDIVSAVRKMIASGDMPERGNYQFETELHGPIWYTMARDDLLLNLHRFGQQYTRSHGFMTGMLGLRYYTDSIDVSVMDEEKTKRLRERKEVRDRFKHGNDMRAVAGKWSGKFYEQLLKKKTRTSKKRKHK